MRRINLIYELREYYIAPGKGEALHRRFKELTTKLFEKHGIKVVGYWDVRIGEAPKMVYICQFDDFTHFENAWGSFLKDPEWIKGKQESEKDGALTVKVTSTILTPTDYSPLQ